MSESDKPKLVEYKISKADFNEKGEIYIVELLSDNSFIKVNGKTKSFMDEIDGIKTYKQITTKINQKFNSKLTENQVRNIIINKMGSSGMVEGIRGRKSGNYNSRLWFHWSLGDGKKFIRLADKFTFLFNPLVVSFLIGFIFIIFIVLFSDININNLFKKEKIFFFKDINLFIIFIMILLTSVFHEFGHIVASFKYNVRPRKVGIGLYLLMPVFFVDLSESWLLDRKKRCIIDLGGIYFQVLSILVYLPMAFMNNSVFNITNYKIIIYATVTNILFNLNPTLRMDGYWALSDLTGIVNIHLRVRKRLQNAVKRILNIKIIDESNYELTDVAKRIFTIWSLAYTSITILFLYMGVSKLISLINRDDLSLLLLIVFIISFVMLKVITSIFRGKLNS